jgi:hypothetical protein
MVISKGIHVKNMTFLFQKKFNPPEALQRFPAPKRSEK